jgi:hypothetical protein
MKTEKCVRQSSIMINFLPSALRFDLSSLNCKAPPPRSLCYFPLTSREGNQLQGREPTIPMAVSRGVSGVSAAQSL